MIKSIYISLSLLILLFCMSVYAEDMYNADFLQQLSSAKGNGMGGNAVAYSIGASALNNNPAGLPFGKGSQFAFGSYSSPRFSYTIMRQNRDELWQDFGIYEIEPTELAYLNYAVQTGKFGSFGISLVYNHEGRFIRVNEDGKAINAFPKDDLLLGFGYGVRLTKGFALGFDIKSLRSKQPIEKGNDIGRTYAMNIGFMHQISEKARIGANINNIGNKLSFKSNDIPSKLRRNIDLSALYNIVDKEKSKLSVSLGINPPFDDGIRYNGGIEFIYANILALRLGYMRNEQAYYDPFLKIIDGTSTKDERLWICQGMTYGVGIKLKRLDANIALMPVRKPKLDDQEKLSSFDQKSIVSFSFGF